VPGASERKVHPVEAGVSEYGVARLEPEICTGTDFTRVAQLFEKTSAGGLPAGSPSTWTARYPSVRLPEAGKLRIAWSVMLWLPVHETVTWRPSTGEVSELQKSGVPPDESVQSNSAATW
jgi:hypothetical protein